jgi:O-antigen/teichoic acid export membrane protein
VGDSSGARRRDGSGGSRIDHQDQLGIPPTKAVSEERILPEGGREHVFSRARRPVAGILRSRTVWQAAGFASSSLLGSILGVVATALLTRNLTTSEFGNYSFAVSLLTLVALFFEFGIISPAARLAALNQARERREIVGSALLLYAPIGAAFSVTIFGLSFFVDSWFHVDAGSALRAAAVVAVGFPFVLVLQRLAQGVDRLHVASASTPFAQLLLVVLLGVAVAVERLSTTSALTLRSVSLLLATVTAAVWLRPLFTAARRWVPELIRQTRQWGFHVFVGRILSIGTYNMDVLMLGIWTNSRTVGFYALAGSLATASGLPVTAMATALFARMAHAPAIDRRWLTVALAVGAACAVTAWLLAEPAIRIVFSPRYVPAAALVLPLALAQFARGLTSLFVNFMSAHARGREMRNAGLILTGSNVLFNFALIPPFGAQGAAWASLFALLLNLGGYVMYYRRFYSL